MRSRRPHSSASRQQQRDRLVRDAILGVVEIDPDRLRGQALPACRVVGEERAEVPRLRCVPVAWSAFHDWRAVNGTFPSCLSLNTWIPLAMKSL
jgi:hypothetical protein